MSFTSTIRMAVMLALLTGLFLAIGFFFAGTAGMTIGLIFAFMMNFLAYFFSDSIVLRMYGAKKLEDKKISAIVEKLAKKAGIPKPKTYIVNMDVPNAFATGRSPKHSAVAVTRGLLDKLNESETEGVLAHEISHIKNRDTLVQTVAATIAGAISWLAYAFMFGDEDRNIFSTMLLFVLAPLAATLIQLSISRGREYMADAGGAKLSNPLDLASALGKISAAVKEKPSRGNAATSHLFIINPFSGSSVAGLFATHPPVEERVRRLKEMAK